MLLGALLGVPLHWLAATRSDDGDTIRVRSAEVARLRAEWTARWNRPPTPQELDGVIQATVRERVLHREALRLGLDRDEPLVRRVLVQKLERIADDLIELSLAPTEPALEEYHRTHAERYRPETLLELTQIYVDADARGESATAHAETLLAELRTRGEAATREANELGDRIMLQHHLGPGTPQRIAALFGAEFADAAAELAPGAWHGPIRSGYGLHLVFVHTREEFPVPPLEEVRARVRQDWVDEKRREIREQYYADLLARYEVVVEDAPGGAPPATDSGERSAAGS